MDAGKVDAAVAVLLDLTPDERVAVLEKFCRVCHEPLKFADWTGCSYCFRCSPDPRD